MIVSKKKKKYTIKIIIKKRKMPTKINYQVSHNSIIPLNPVFMSDIIEILKIYNSCTI